MLIENFSQYPARRLEIQSALQFLMVHAWTPPKSKKDENCPTNELTGKKNTYAKKNNNDPQKISPFQIWQKLSRARNLNFKTDVNRFAIQKTFRS